MTKKISDLRLNMSPESQLCSQAMTEKMLREIPSHQLKQARYLSQQMLAQVLDVQQSSIAKLEKRADMYLSTLRTHIEAMGGELEIIAHFPYGRVRVSHFSNLEIELEPGKSRHT
ncbi:XRE family transcriptional regulator [Methylophilus sp. 5]|uniref:XRE family transcriptional regulator n=1 Tax=Methylophilus sp. 5 TaxID=1112274 RepID=UPI00056A9749|nr:XRE family transcriptional regulator [Methylophilus sp. 5]